MITELFTVERIQAIAQYLSPAHNQVAYAKIISGRLLEEAIELHLESGGDALSAMGHVMDVITNESFKEKARLSDKKIEAYPSKIQHSYNKDKVLSEISDMFMMFILNMLNLDRLKKFNSKDIEALQKLVADRVDEKLRKLDIAREEDRLIMTESGTYYIDKGI